MNQKMATIRHAPLDAIDIAALFLTLFLCAIASSGTLAGIIAAQLGHGLL